MRPQYLIVFAIGLLFSCKKNISTNQIENKTIIDEQWDSTSTTINNVKYIAYQNGTKNLFILNEANDTIYKHLTIATNNFEFVDFDNDGFKDLLINQISNLGGVYELILFDNKSNEFKLIRNFMEFPSPTKIDGTIYYYSYQRSGCADSDWNSDLFYIKNYAAIRIGKMTGRACESEKTKGIFISRIINGNEIRLIERPIPKSDTFDKWKYISNFWTENYMKFE